METSIAKIEAKDFKLEEKDVAGIAKAFQPKIAERDGYIKIYGDIITKEINPDLCTEAGELRKKLVKVRTGIASIHKTQKAFFHQAGLYVDAWKNKETLPVTQMESKLSEIENYYELQEQERINALQIEREKEVALYIDNAKELDLGGMDDDMWDMFKAAKKKSYEERIKAEKEAAKKAKEDAEETERLRVENAKLKKVVTSVVSGQGDKPNGITLTDDQKIENLINHLDAVRLSFSFKSKKNKSMHEGVCILMDKVITYINEKKA